jgi:hypothetical protein
MTNIIELRRPPPRDADIMAPVVLWMMGVSLMQVAMLAAFYAVWHR